MAWSGGSGVWANSVAHTSRRRANRIPLWWHSGTDHRLAWSVNLTKARRLTDDKRRSSVLPHLHFVQPVGALQDFGRLAAVRRTDDTVALHAIQNARRTPVAQAKMPLQGRRRSLSHLEHETHGVFVLRVLLLVGKLALGRSVAFVGRRDQEALVVFRLVLSLPEIDHALDLRLRNERAVHACQARGARRQEQHVALAQQVLGTHHVENGPRIYARGHTEADARREVGLDQAGDHVHAGTLRGQHQVHAHGA